MCYKITTHSLHCDARPLISDGHRDIVNGYAGPTPCPCPPNPDVGPWLRCPHHGCCRITTRIQPCTRSHNPCTAPKFFHLYECATTATGHWAPLAVLDGAVRSSAEPTAIEGADWLASFASLVKAGSHIKFAQDLRGAVQNEIRVLETVHRMDHGACAGCPRVEEIKFFQGVEAFHAKEIAGLVGEFEFGAWLVCKGEIKGARAVSGLNVKEGPVAPVHRIPF